MVSECSADAAQIGLVLGYQSYGAVLAAIHGMRARGITPVLVGDRQVKDYGEVLPPNRRILSDDVIRHPARVAERLTSSLRRIFPAGHVVTAIVNWQDRMWPLYLRLAAAFPEAATIPAAMIADSALKANLRHVLRRTPYHVKHELLRLVGAERAIQRASMLGDRVILKPVAGSAGEEVHCVTRLDGAEVRRALNSIRQSYKQFYGKSNEARVELRGAGDVRLSDYVLVEEFLEGTEYSIEGFVDSRGHIDPLVILRKTDTRPRPFRDLEYVSAPDDSERDRLGKAVRDLLKRIRYRGNAFHLEVMVTRSGPKPIELNPRQGGGSICDLVEALTGVNLRSRSLHYMLRERGRDPTLLLRVIQPSGDMAAGRYRLVGCPGFEGLRRDDKCIYARRFVDDDEVIPIGIREHYLVEFGVAERDEVEARARARRLERGVTPEFAPVQVPGRRQRSGTSLR